MPKNGTANASHTKNKTCSVIEIFLTGAGTNGK